MLTLAMKEGKVLNCVYHEHSHILTFLYIPVSRLIIQETKLKWFKHDSNASIDAKIEKLIIRYGLEGYGLYFYCLELIAQNIEFHNLTFELEHDAEVIAHRVKLHSDHVQEMMTYMIDLKLFENNAGVITCLKMAQRLDSSMVSNPKMRKMITDIRESHDSIMIPSADSHDGVMQEEKRIDKIRIDNNKPSPKSVNGVPYQKIVDLYHQELPTLPKVEKLTATRKAQIRQRWLQDLPDLNQWENFFYHVKQSKFLMGMTPPNNGHKPFKANLEWLTKESNFVKISEDTYHG